MLAGFGGVLITPAVHAQASSNTTTADPSDSDPRITLSGNTHPLARAEFDRGEAPADLAMTRMLFVLKRNQEQEAQLQQLLINQQDKSSPDYHHWLTPDQLGSRFGPSASDVSLASSWLRGNGFSVERVSASRLFIEFSGTAGLVKKAFQAPIHHLVMNGHDHWANLQDPTIPNRLAPIVAGVDSLNSFRRQPQHTFLGTASVREHRTLSSRANYTVQLGSDLDYSVAPYDFAAIYDLLPLWKANPGINGKGQSIAIPGRSDIHPSESTTFWSLFGLDGVHESQPKLNLIYDGPNPGITEDESEADIDVQWSGATAPGVNINLVVSASTLTTDGVDLSSLYIVDNNLSPIVSDSFGQCEAALGSAGVQFYGSLWEQAAAQGISVLVASGDNGAAGCDDPDLPASNGFAVSGLASTPYNLAVGGTDFNQYNKLSTYWASTNNAVTQQSAVGYIPETTWNDSCTNQLVATLPGASTDAEINCNTSDLSGLLNSTGGSGGLSKSWMKPGWQTGTPADSARDLPDLSLFAGNGFVGSSYVICDQDITAFPCGLGEVAAFGGTSVAAPAFAGIMALVEQKTGSSLGMLGPSLYKLAGKQPSVLHDIPAGTTIAMPCKSGSADCTIAHGGDKYGILSGYNTATGYDLATGLGSVDAAAFVNSWSSVAFDPSSSTLTLNGGSAVSLVHGASTPVGVTVAPASATGSVALLVSPGTPGNAGIESFALGGGAVNSTTSLLPGGAYSVLAHYGGDSNYGGSYSNAVAVTVTPEGSKIIPHLINTDINGKITNYAATSATYGSGFAALRIDLGDLGATTSTATGVSSTCSRGESSCPTGSVTLSAPGTYLDGLSLPVNAKGYVEVESIAPGTYALSVAYPGDASYSSGTGTINFTVAKAPTTIAADVAGTPVRFDDSMQIDASVSTTSDGIAPTGTFQFYVDGASVGSTISIYENFSYVPGKTPISYAYADAISMTKFPTAGTHTLSVSYSGDAYYAANNSSNTTVTVIKDQADLFYLSWGAATTAAYGQTVTASANLEFYPDPAPSTGTVTFFDNGIALTGTVTYTENQLATIPVTLTATGSHSLTASFSGDANYDPTTSAIDAVPPAVITVGPPVSVAAAGAVTVASPGQSGTTTLTLKPLGGFNGSITLSCVSDPGAIGATCAFANGSATGTTLQLSLAGSPVNVTFSVATEASQQSTLLPSPFNTRGSAVLALSGLGILCCPLFFRKRKTWLTLLFVVFTLGITACGGGSSGGGGTTPPKTGTAAGTYKFQAIATGTSTASAFTLDTLVTVSVE